MKRSNKVTLMVSDEELERLRELAHETGLSQSSLLRSVLHAAPPSARTLDPLRVTRPKKLG